MCVQVDQRFPTLSRHLTRHGVNVSNMALQWFLCIFVNSLPLESCFRVWDLFFFDRCASVLFRCGLALVDTYSQVRFGFSFRWSYRNKGLQPRFGRQVFAGECPVLQQVQRSTQSLASDGA